MTCRLLLGMLTAVLLAPPALAQTVYLHSGASFPTSTLFNDVHTPGIEASMGIGIPVSSQFEVLLRGGVNRFGTNRNQAQTFSSYSMLAYLKWNGPWANARLHPYALAGVGNFVEVEGPFALEVGSAVGAGLSLRTSPRTRLLIEPNYVLVFTEGESREYIPVRLGVAYNLQ